jgi:hypothetical protein
MKSCPNCETQNESKSKFCKKCGNDLSNESPINHTEPLSHETREKGALEHLQIGYQIALTQPIVFLPSIITGLLGILVGYLPGNTGYSALLIGLAISIISFILSFASTDMSRDAYFKQPLELGKSVNYIVGRFFEFLLAAIVGGLLSITIILIPVVIFMFVIMVLDEAAMWDSFSSALDVIRSDLKDVIVILILSIVASVIVGYVPFFSSLLDSMINVIVGIAFIDVYVTYKGARIDTAP